MRFIGRSLVSVFCLVGCVAVSGMGSAIDIESEVLNTYSCTVIAEMFVNGVRLNNVDDQLLFIDADGNFGGISESILLPNGTYVYFTTVQSSQPIDTFDMFIFDSTTGHYSRSPQAFYFAAQDIVGSVDTPFVVTFDNINGGSLAINSIPDQTTLEGYAFDTIDLSTYLVQVGNLPVTWYFVPNSSISATIIGDQLVVSGNAGFTGQTILQVFVIDNGTPLPSTTFINFEVVPIYLPPLWDPIPGQSTVRGGFFDSIPLHDYENQFQGPEILYDYLPVVEIAESPELPPSDWSITTPFVNNMTLTLDLIYTPRYRLDAPSDIVAGFIDGTIRGVATKDPTTGLYFLTVGGDSDAGKAIELRFYSGERQQTLIVDSLLAYQPHGISGSIGNPLVVDYAPIVPTMPLGAVTSGISTIPVDIVDTSFIGTQRFFFYAYDAVFPQFLFDSVMTTFCVVADSTDLLGWYVDNDGDGYGSPDGGIFSCDSIPGYVSNNLDCDDSSSLDPDVVISVIEQSASIDNDGVVCTDDVATLSVDAALAYQWSTGDVTQTANVVVANESTYRVTVTTSAGCVGINEVIVMVEDSVVVQSGDDGLGSLRSVLACVDEGGTIRYDYPSVDSTYLTQELLVTKDVSIVGDNSTDRPSIVFVPSSGAVGLSIDGGKVLRLDNVDLVMDALGGIFDDAVPILGPGVLAISGTTQIGYR